MLTHPIATLMNRFGLASPTRHLPGIPCTSAVFQQPFFKTESARYTRRAVALPDGRRFLNPFQIHGKDLVFMTGLARRCAVQKVLDEQGVSLTPVSLGFGQTAMGVAITDFSANSLAQDPDNPTAPFDPHSTGYLEATLFTFVYPPAKSLSRMWHMCPIKLFVDDAHLDHFAQLGGVVIAKMPKVPGTVRLQKPTAHQLVGTVYDEAGRRILSVLTNTLHRTHIPVVPISLHLPVVTRPGTLGGSSLLMHGACAYLFDPRKDHLSYDWGQERGMEFKPAIMVTAEGADYVVGANDSVFAEQQT